MEIHTVENFGHEYLHTAIPTLIEEGTLLHFSSLIRPGLEERQCQICAKLLVDNYPAVELYMDWTGFNEFERWAFFKAVELLDKSVILNKPLSTWEWPLIFRAISNNHIEFVKHLVQISLKFLNQKCDNDSVLQFALTLGRTEIVIYLIDLVDKNPTAAQYLHVGKAEFEAACTSSVCGLTIVFKLLDIVMNRKEKAWTSSLYRGFQIMGFKRPDSLKQVLNYFLDRYPDEVNVLYESSDDSEIILFALAHENMTSAVLKILDIAPEAAYVTNTKTGKSLLMRAIELDNIELASTLLEEYKLDINTKDLSGHNCFTYASIHGNLSMMEYLLKKGIDTPIKVQPNTNEEVRIIPCEDLMKFTVKAANGSLDLNIFNDMVRCLYETYPNSFWPWIRSDNSSDFLFPELLPEKTMNDLKDSFDMVYKILHQYKVTLRCSNVLDTIMLDTTIPYKRKEIAVKSGILQSQMSLMIAEPNLESFLSPEMYVTKEFELIKDYINIEDFNEICIGREVASLKRACRSVIRREIFSRTFIKELYEFPLNAQSLMEKAFNTLPVPKRMIRYLRYQY